MPFHPSFLESQENSTYCKSTCKTAPFGEGCWWRHKRWPVGTWHISFALGQTEELPPLPFRACLGVGRGRGFFLKAPTSIPALQILLPCLPFSELDLKSFGPYCHVKPCHNHNFKNASEPRQSTRPSSYCWDKAPVSEELFYTGLAICLPGGFRKI